MCEHAYALWTCVCSCLTCLRATQQVLGNHHNDSGKGRHGESIRRSGWKEIQLPYLAHATVESLGPDVQRQSATPATPTAAAATPATPAQARHRSQPHAIRATPATQSDGRCHQVPRLPRETKVDVAKCHACHANGRGGHPGHSRPMPYVPRLPRKVKVDVTKYHACHVKPR